MNNDKVRARAWWMATRLAFSAPAMAGMLPMAAEAQRQCEAGDRVGWVGIAGIECSNCTIAFPGNGRTSRFSTEPRITEIAPGSPAAGSLAVGDVLVSVNGSLITTTEGAYKFSNLKPGQSLVLIVRRQGQHLVKRFATLSARCPSDPLVIGSGAPRGTAPTTVPPTGVAPRDRRPSAATAAPGAPAPPGGISRTPPSGYGPAAFQQPRASFGFSIACSDCLLYRRSGNRDAPISWEFASPPEVYSVEANGPAYRAGLRRGDLITHIDGTAITQDEAGRRFATAEPGQTLRFGYRRGNDTRTVAVRAEPRSEVTRSQEAGSALRRARQLIEEMNRRERNDQLRLTRELDRLKQENQTTVLETVERYLREQVAQQQRLTAVQQQLIEAEDKLRREIVSAATRARTAVTSSSVTPPSNRVIRYSGRLGNTDVEVRGGPNVSVTENGDEIIITSGDAVIRLKRR